jgi:hypothetical protein
LLIQEKQIWIKHTKKVDLDGGMGHMTKRFEKQINQHAKKIAKAWVPSDTILDQGPNTLK